MINEDEKWISKYRAALDATPMQQPTTGTLVVRLKEIIQNLVSALNKAADGESTAPLAVGPLEEPPRPKIVLPPTPAGTKVARSHDWTGSNRIERHIRRRQEKSQLMIAAQMCPPGTKPSA